MATKGQAELEKSVWNVEEFTTTEKAWSEKSGSEKGIFVLTQIFKTLLMLLLLYLFIVSLSLMANSFRILGGKTSGRAFRDTELFNNPLAGLVTGILVTVLVQSSSTSTSIIITMTAGELIKVGNAIPMIMGANIGTSVTNTIVSLGQVGSKDEYRRAFAGATVHDMFNLLNVCLFLPIEAITGMLRHIASAIADGMDVTDSEDKESKTDMLKVIVKPLNNRILSIDKKLITSIAKAKTEADVEAYESKSIIKHGQKDDNHMFMDTPLSDGVAGFMMVLVSLLFLCLCLILMVKVLQSIFRGRTAIMTRRMINFEIKGAPGLSNYILIVFGGALTVMFQSSSVTTSTLTPLVGIGLIRIEKMFAFTVGANMGTCITGILSALVTDKRHTALTVAFSHLLFNVLGTVVWYPIPQVRNIPIAMAKLNGNIAADYKWWPYFYIIAVFLAFPALLLAVSAVSVWLLVALGVPALILLAVSVTIVALRFTKPDVLPVRFRSDHAKLPRALRINKVLAEGDTQAPESASSAAGDADIGAKDWRFAPVAWGGGWFVFIALLLGSTNAKWADIKFPGFDGRGHVGFSAWQACSYDFKDKDVAWAKPYDMSACDINTCATSASMSKCLTVSFSDIPDINKEYEKSWVACRETCPMFTWQAWCENQGCGGTLHNMQCQNVTGAVMRPYVVTYGPTATSNTVHAWTKGERCRRFEDICDTGSKVKVAGDVGVVALVCTIIAQISVIAYTSMHKSRDMTMLLTFSLVFWALAWLFCLVSWLSFISGSNAQATCMVTDVSATGAVLATGAFKDIAQSSYTFGCVLGSWLMIKIVMVCIAVRLATASNLADQMPGAQDEEANVMEPVGTSPVAMEAVEEAAEVEL